MKTRHLVWPSVMAVCLGIAQPVGAHRLDEYLQATRIAVGQERIELELDLTPGASIATQIVGLIDANGDGRISAAESDQYARRVIEAIHLSLDGRPLPMTLVSREFPDRNEMSLGVGSIRLRATAPATRGGTGHHALVYLNTHAVASSVYLVNALLPSDPRIQIASQSRDEAQRGVTVNYIVAPSGVWFRGGWLVAAIAMIGFVRKRRRGQPNS
jgi:hypothetical protein